MLLTLEVDVCIVVTEDHAIEAGNIAASSSSHSLPQLWGHEETSDGSLKVNGEQWLMNYQEAAIYLEEGENNEKFDTHPKSQSALPAYIIGGLIANRLYLHILLVGREPIGGLACIYYG